MESVSSEFIKSSEALDLLLAEVGDEAVCAVDTEADSLHRYSESLCLIQFAWGDRCVLIDPLALEDLGPFYDYLTKSAVWMHGADYDMTMIRRECGRLPKKVYDTQIGARLLGVGAFGLGNLVEHYFGICLSKSSQKADWGKRPLSSKMIDYALNDVRYLLPMGQMIVEGLKEIGRYEWFVESCEWSRAKVLERDASKDEPWRIQGAGRLDRVGLHYLKVLWNWRDAEAEQWDRPSFMVVTNKQLIDWSQKLAAGSRIELPNHYRADRKRRFSAMMKEAESVAPADFPMKLKGQRRRTDRNFDQKVNELIERRNLVGKELGIDGSLIASRAMIEALAAGDEGYESQWMAWQKQCLGMA